ncbi:MAG: small ribosomal subunit Rsm22 family protein [Bacteroidota bacterium]|jgi:ribosomal protein RSM22 (predicted rRNA methylase)|nr:small ribosomal subunit Rsm22 family protein [Bacteroidota bacterium]
MSATTPPVVLPGWWPDVLRQFLGIADFTARSLAPFAAPLARLSDTLNDVDARRASTSAYMRDSRLRLAYQLYYLSVNLLKPRWALNELYPSGPPAGHEPFRVLDLGCGPGTGVAAMHAWAADVRSTRRIHVDGIDAVEANVARFRELGALLSAESGSPVDCDAWKGDATRPVTSATPYEVVMAMNLLNEIPETRHPHVLARCGAVLRPGGVLLLIEPALRETTRPLLRLRDRAVRSGWTVMLPCHRQGACPALENEKDWCHHSLPWERPPFIAFLDEAIGNVKTSLKFSCIVLRNDAATDVRIPAEEGGTEASGDRDSFGMDRERLRVVSEPFVEKGRRSCYCCGASGRRLYQRNDRDRSDVNAAFDLVTRWDSIDVRGAEPRRHDVKITAETRVRAVTSHPADR